jgi:signal recognition particle receptor subunit beta
MRTIWGNYARSSDGFIFVIDGKDVTRLDEAKQALFATLNYYEEGHIPPILLLLNKFDGTNEEPPESTSDIVQSWISELGQVNNGIYTNNQRVSVAYISALTGKGLIDALALFDSNLIHLEPS